MSGFFDVLPEPERTRVVSIARRRVFAKRTVVFHAGDPGDAMHVVRKGRFAVQNTSGGLDVNTMAILGPGDHFGELALLSGDSIRTASVVALEAGETLSLHRVDFEKVLREYPLASTVLLHALRGQVERLSARLVEALYVTADTRVRHRLVELATMYAAADDPDGPVTIPLTQEDLASLAGTSRATVNRVLGEEKDAATVDVRRGKVAITDRTKLEARAARGR
ncbi:Cyclic AMP receptor protein [Paraconexibacter sp. AEG42_29]|uniref:Cyclic AMP receptor protein n=1 Tax=Paraconexibacter sp. AEG42_29 TaxID=2997339 RepID=A0AAU7B2H8_9ACTN